MKFKNLCVLTALLTTFLLLGQTAFALEEAKTTDSMTTVEKEKHKKHILENADKTLKELYADKPDIQKEVEGAYGYAVFTNTGYNLAIFVGGSGHGVAFNNQDKKPIFMAMKKAGTGPGLGYVKYRQVITFANEMLFEEFLTVGMQGSASANLTLKKGVSDSDTTANLSLVPGVTFYQITDEGIDVQANWGGMMYYKDSELD